MKSKAVVMSFCLAAAVFLPCVLPEAAEAANTMGETRVVERASGQASERTIALARESAGQEAGAMSGTSSRERDALPMEKEAMAGAAPAARPAVRTEPLKLRFVWPAVADAVRYEFTVQEGTGTSAKTVYREEHVFNNGLELPVKGRGWLDRNHYWRVRALRIDGTPLNTFSEPVALEIGEKDPTGPLPTSEYAHMDYAPLYPAYSWVAVSGAKEYEISVWKRNAAGPALLHLLYSTDLTCYDSHGFTVPGTYYWKVRALDAARQPISGWSDDVVFEVTRPTPVAALGDSITHGGGAVVYGPDRRIYSWETYAAFPIKNLGYSGDTVEAMEARFDRDVLPFRPQILVIMGGVNNYRAGARAAEIIPVLERLRDKCKAHDIIPVFLTGTSLNPGKIASLQYAQNPPPDWSDQQALMNRWVMEQPYCVDVTTTLSDASGQLEDIYTTDGLHPDSVAKRFIGETVSNYLRAKFPKIIGPLLRPAK